MSFIPNTSPANSSYGPSQENIAEVIPVGGTDPDFVTLERTKSALCSIPVLGKMLPQSK